MFYKVFMVIIHYKTELCQKTKSYICVVHMGRLKLNEMTILNDHVSSSQG